MASILLNDNILSHAVQGGVTRFFRKITDGVIRHFGENVVVLSSDVRDYSPAKHVRNVGLFGHGYGLSATILANIVFPKAILSSYYGNMRAKSPEVYVVYDMIHELLSYRMPQHSLYERRFVAEKKACIERASTLIAISSSTANDIAHCYPYIDTRKIITAPLGVDEFFFSAAGALVKQRSKPYILYVGRRSLYKNFLRLLIAYGESGIAGEVDLCVISSESNSFLPQEAEQIRRYSLQENVHLLGSVDEQTLKYWYAASLAFVYPSEYEGFGLPILEAMASGTLVATSNISSMPEVGGDAAFYFDPLQTESIAVTLKELIAISSEERSRRVVAGIAHARTFSWLRCQQTVIDVLQHFL